MKIPILRCYWHIQQINQNLSCIVHWILSTCCAEIDKPGQPLPFLRAGVSGQRNCFWPTTIPLFILPTADPLRCKSLRVNAPDAAKQKQFADHNGLCWARAVKLLWILCGAPLTFNRAIGNIQGNIDRYDDVWHYCFLFYSKPSSAYTRLYTRPTNLSSEPMLTGCLLDNC